MRVSENRGPEYSTLSSRILIISYKNPKIRYPLFSETPKMPFDSQLQQRERESLWSHARCRFWKPWRIRCPNTLALRDGLRKPHAQKEPGLIPSRGLACFVSLSQFLSWSSRVFQVSGVSFQFDAAKPPNQRIVEGSVRTEPQYSMVQGMPASFTFPLLCLRSQRLGQLHQDT